MADCLKRLLLEHLLLTEVHQTVATKPRLNFILFQVLLMILESQIHDIPVTILSIQQGKVMCVNQQTILTLTILYISIDSKIARLVADYEQNSSGQGSKRTLPTSFQPPAPSLRSTNLVENFGSSQMRETYSAQLKPTFGMNHVKSKSGMGSDDEVLMYENSGNRVLPPSFTHAKFASTAPYVSSADSGFRSAAGEERVSEYDERLIYQAALQVFLSGH